MKGRAKTYEEKRAIVERILAIWSSKPELRLGQLLVGAYQQVTCRTDIFYVEDERLAELVEGL
jgi:hypothetical protein